MNTTLTPTYQQTLVGLSYLIAVAGSFVALMVARRIRSDGDSFSNRINILTAGVALGGVGVWAMHFVGMLALRLGVGVGYSAIETLISLVAAIAAASFALGYVAKAPRQLGRLLVGGTLLGLGVGAMHYLGMFGMRFGGYMVWSYGTVALSLVIAILAAVAALWLAFNTNTWPMRLLAALVMGVAVCAMHYTGMSAVDFVCTTENRNSLPYGFGVVVALQLPVWVTMFAFATLFLVGLMQMLDWTDGAKQQQLPH